MGLLTGMLKVAVDVVTLPVAVAADVVTLGDAQATKKVSKNLNNDVEDVFTGGDGNLI